MPSWVEEGYAHYAKRMPADCRLELIEIPAGQRRKNVDIARVLKKESDKQLAAIPNGCQVIALDVAGRTWSTTELAHNLSTWMGSGRDIALLVGGPEGLHADVLQRAELRWSLSPLTFPHPLVRIVLAEQLYRGLSLLRNHPYHRA